MFRLKVGSGMRIRGVGLNFWDHGEGSRFMVWGLRFEAGLGLRFSRGWGRFGFHVLRIVWDFEDCLGFSFRRFETGLGLKFLTSVLVEISFESTGVPRS